MENQYNSLQSIWAIALDESEQKLFNETKAFSSSNSFERNREILQSVETLTKSLKDSKKIPASRINYFTKPEYNISNRKRSRKEIFEGNGTSGDAIYSHPQFIEYLLYFVNGAKLPTTIKEKAEELIVNAHFKDMGCGEFIKYLKDHKLIPKDLQSRNTFSEEIFKLAIDANCDIHSAIRLRNHVKNKR
ncbi:MAG: hypothetical protein SH818_00870 [Saprospiraceae bacterium]|nr:hypothetical protein [Saprospiraceae bacterium]